MSSLSIESNQARGSMNQSSPSLDNQEVDISARERSPQLPSRDEQISEHPRFESPTSHVSQTPGTQPRVDNRDPAREQGMHESIPLRSSEEGDQEMQCSPNQKDTRNGQDIEALHVRELSLLRIWWLEIAACVLIVLIIAAIVGTLYPYQDQPKPNWPYDLSTNTILAFYVVIMKIALVSILSAGT